MNRNPYQRAEQAALVAAARLTPKLLSRGLAVILLCEITEAIGLAWMGHPHDIQESILGWLLLTVVGLPVLYFSSLPLVTEVVAREVAGNANAQFESIAAQLHDGILIFDLHGRIVYCNLAAERIHAAPPGSLLGQPLESIIPEDSRASFREDLETFRKTGTGLVIGKRAAEVDGLRRDGRRLALEISTASLPWGVENHIVAVIRDVSDRKRLDAEITRLARFPLMNPNPILECAPDGAILYANPGAKKLLGMIPSAASMTDLIPRFTELAQRCLLDDSAVVEAEAAARNHTLLWALYSAAEAGCILAYGTDITARKQAEQARQQSERQVLDLLDALPVGVRVVVEEKTAFANSAAAQLYGFPSPRNLIGLDAMELVAQKDVERVRDYHRRRVAGENPPRQYEVSVRRADGSETPVEVTAKRFFYSGQPASLLVLRDLTTQKRLQLYEQILPVCCMCGQIRDDAGAKHGEGAWGRLDHYVMRHSDTQLSHTFCPACFEQYRREQGLVAT